MLKAKEVISYYEDGTKITIFTSDKVHKTTIEKDRHKSTVEITEEEIKTEVGSVDQRLENAGTKIVSNGFIRKWPESEEKKQFYSIEVGNLTDEEMRRFNLGPYSKEGMIKRIEELERKTDSISE